MLKYLTVVGLLLALLVGGIANGASVQTCAATSQALKYHVWRIYPEDQRGFTVVVVSVDDKHFNRQDMTALAARLKQEFAGQARVKIGLLDDPDTARLFVEGRVNYATYEKAERGRYYLDRTKCYEYIRFSMRRGQPKKTIPIKCSV
jgi:hypothetical protein